jgi:hypothetical protein
MRGRNWMIGTGLIGAGMLLGVASTAAAGAVNCKQVNKYLQTGRTVKDVAETMVIDEADVKKCQAEAEANKSAEKPAGEHAMEEKK